MQLFKKFLLSLVLIFSINTLTAQKYIFSSMHDLQKSGVYNIYEPLSNSYLELDADNNTIYLREEATISEFTFISFKELSQTKFLFVCKPKNLNNSRLVSICLDNTKQMWEIYIMGDGNRKIMSRKYFWK